MRAFRIAGEIVDRAEWHKADIPTRSINVRFWGKADIVSTSPNVC